MPGWRMVGAAENHPSLLGLLVFRLVSLHYDEGEDRTQTIRVSVIVIY